MQIDTFNEIAKGAIEEFIEESGREFEPIKENVEILRKACEKLDKLINGDSVDFEKIDIAITFGITTIHLQCDLFVPDWDKEVFYDMLEIADSCKFTYDGPDLMSVILTFPSTVERKVID